MGERLRNLKCCVVETPDPMTLSVSPERLDGSSSIAPYKNGSRVKKNHPRLYRSLFSSCPERQDR